MDKKIKISIFMANFNKGVFIEEAIRSVLEQNYENWELIIIDDCSTDNSNEVIVKFLYDRRIRFLKNKINLGKVKTLKKMIEISSGEIIGILDSDDVLLPDALKEIGKAYAVNPEYGFVYTRSLYCDEKLNEIGEGESRYMPSGQSNIFDLYVTHFRTFKKSLFLKTEGYDEEVMIAEDRDKIMKMEEVTNFYFIDKILHKYRILPDSQCHKRKALLRVSLAVAKYKAYKRRIGSDIPNLNPKQISDLLLWDLFSCLMAKKWKLFWFFLFESWKLYPFNMTGIIKMLFRLIKYPPNNIYRKIVHKKIYEPRS